MSIDIDEITDQRFTIRFRGFDVKEVDAFLVRIAQSYRQLVVKNKDIDDHITRAKVDLEKAQNENRALKQSVKNTQQILTTIEKNSRQTAEVMIAEARVKSERMLNRTHKRLAQLHQEITEMKRQRIQIEVQIRSILETHGKLLDVSREETASSDASAEKVAIFNRSQK